MKKIIVTLIAFTAVSGFAQQALIDSLRGVLKKEKDPEKRIELYEEVAKEAKEIEEIEERC